MIIVSICLFQAQEKYSKMIIILSCRRLNLHTANDKNCLTSRISVVAILKAFVDLSKYRLARLLINEGMIQFTQPDKLETVTNGLPLLQNFCCSCCPLSRCNDMESGDAGYTTRFDLLQRQQKISSMNKILTYQNCIILLVVLV